MSKVITTVVLLIAYICTMGAVTFSAELPEGKIEFTGWLI